MNHQKALDCFHKLTKEKPNIIFIQETNIKKCHNYPLHCPKLGEKYVTSGPNNKWGVVTYTNLKGFKIEDMLADITDRYLCIKDIFKEQKITLVNIYAPNTKPRILYIEIARVLDLFVEGDFSMGL